MMKKAGYSMVFCTRLRVAVGTGVTSCPPTQQYGGLGALIIEGEACTGKKTLVQSVFNVFGFEEGRDYITLRSSMPVSNKKSCLLEAFHQGLVVVMEDLNASSRMEQLLNALLMGKTPEGQRAEKPGFLIIGIQKPTHLAGLKLASNALDRRMQTCYLTPYDKDEQNTLLRQKNVTHKETLNALITVFHDKQQADLKPLLTDLFNVAEGYRDSNVSIQHPVTFFAQSLFKSNKRKEAEQEQEQDDTLPVSQKRRFSG